MFNLDKFLSDSVTFRPASMFEPDIQANAIVLTREIKGKKECASDAEAKQYASEMSYEGTTYPVVYFKSDTTGEKAYEEFYVPGEMINMRRFHALGVVEQTTRHSFDEVAQFFGKLEGIFAQDDFTKAQVVEAIKEFIPNFEHEEKGKNLDSKM